MSISRETLADSQEAWEYLGPIANGGTVFGVAVSPVSDISLCWAATGCGIFMSEDDGKTWVQNLEGLTTPLLSTLAVAPNGALFTGALNGEIFASFDYGKRFERGLVPSELQATVTDLVASPNFREDGTVFAATDGGGVLVSRSSGDRWEDSSFGLGDLTVLALVTTPDWSDREIMFAATTDGVFTSRNGGRAWRETELMLYGEDIVDVIAVSPAFDEDRTVYAGTEGGDVYRSTNGGRAWTLLQKEVGEGPVNCLWLSPDYAETKRVIVGAGDTLLVSSDGGESFVTKEMPGTVLALNGDEGLLLAGLHNDGIWRSADAGDTWEPAESFAARGFARLVPADGCLYAMGPQEGLWLSDDKGQSWRPLEGLVSYLPLSDLSVPAADIVFVVSQEYGILRSLDGGMSWNLVQEREGIGALLVLDNGDGWAGTVEGRLLLTHDGGETWQDVESPCEGQEILSLVASPNYAQDRTLFMGTSIPAQGSRGARVALWRSTNGGADWRQVTTQVTSARWADIAMPVGVGEGVSGQAVVATGPYCLRPLRRAKDVWISTKVDPDEANTLSVVAVGEVDEGGVLVAATGNGIYRSIDGGRTWQPFSKGLTATSFVSIVGVQNEARADLYALSLGGTLWRRGI
ncbi:MAG: hypothetical protein U9R48_10680 [Chloroflexota bacterium]|nr:hypothetical protein [Chloroflexota bacterium]